MSPIEEDFDKIYQTAISLAQARNNTAQAELLSIAKREIQETSYDNWNGGTTGYSINLDIPIVNYVQFEARLGEVEAELQGIFGVVTKRYANQFVERVTISPSVDVPQEITLSHRIQRSSNTKKVFVSYQTSDKIVAGRIKSTLERMGYPAFLAHDDITVSEEWREQILKQLAETSIFVCLLSKSYLESHWCIQESGIAVFSGMTIIPLSLDGTIPMGFMSKFQSGPPSKNGFIDPLELLPGLIRHGRVDALNAAIELLGNSGNFRGAEANFGFLSQYFSDLTEDQCLRILTISLANNQIYGASECARKHIPELVRQFRKSISDDMIGRINEYLASYKVVLE